jgi:hypothetical protein
MQNVNIQLLFTLARVIIAGLLFWSAWNPSFNFNLFFKLAVVAIAVWSFFRALEEEESAVLIFCILVALVFNPFFQMHFKRGTWRAIDIVVGILLLLSIFLLDSAPFNMLLKKPAGEHFRTLILIVFAVAWMFLGVVSIYYSAKWITTIAKVKINGIETQARITRVTHGYYHTEDANDMPLVYDIYITEYTFQTKDGQSFAGYAELYDNPVSKLSANEFRTQYKDGYELEQDNMIPLSIEYEKDNPSNNRAVNNREGVFDTIFGGISLALFSLWPVISGFKSSKENFLKLLAKGK